MGREAVYCEQLVLQALGPDPRVQTTEQDAVGTDLSTLLVVELAGPMRQVLGTARGNGPNALP